MAGIAEHGQPASFYFLWLLCAHFIVATHKTLTCHNSTLSAAQSCNSDSLEKVQVEMELRKVQGGEVKCVKSEEGYKKGVCVCTYTCVIHLFYIQMPLL